ncbi:unnamed protein product [Mytilus coruscus]|uniref:Uncharacterized protein n=1 Tax=Mytilus coruscus TaxID=42192 RepID=A0A6J8E978_MYTCO|nr:unnamed protein product [Mytilus coruscus]
MSMHNWPESIKLESVACNACDKWTHSKWTHRNCIGMSKTEFSKSEDTWTCPSFSKPNNSSTKEYFILNGDNSKHSKLDISNPSVNGRQNCTKDPHGGVMIAAKKSLQLGYIIKSKDIELITGTINLEENKKMLVGAFYRPPDNTDDTYLNQMTNEINTIRMKH